MAERRDRLSIYVPQEKLKEKPIERPPSSRSSLKQYECGSDSHAEITE